MKVQQPALKPFLKWPGGKYRIIATIRSKLLPGRRLIEPFTGSAAVFLNTTYDNYLLADSNPDLINLYQRLIEGGEGFINYCRRLFNPANNNERVYYRLREEFNRTRDVRRKSALFLFLNRHCYNGLIRYNGSGEFNSPFGRYKKPYFPAREMRHFLRAAERATFIHAGYRTSMDMALKGDIVYCDPPYVPLSGTAYFTDYHTGGFKWSDQECLTNLARCLADRGIQVVISNHDTGATRKMYQDAGARLFSFNVRRTISRDIYNRNEVGELLAVFT